MVDVRPRRGGGALTTAAADWVVDAHLDLAWNALQWNRDLRESVHVLRVREAAEAGSGRGRNTVALPELRAGRVRLCFATVLARSSGTTRPHVDFASYEQANAVALGQLAYYRALERGGHVRVLTDLRGARRARGRGSSAATDRSAWCSRWRGPTPSSTPTT